MVTSSFMLSGIQVPEHFTSKTSDIVFPDIIPILENTSDVKEIEKQFFSQLNEKPSVFISHSSNDENKAQYLKHLIEENTTEEVFIDSLYWDDKLEIIDNIISFYKDNIGNELNNRKFIKIVDNINMMFIRSLRRMIKNCTTFIFIDTSTSTQSNYNGIFTHSPWIYYELLIASVYTEDSVSTESLKAFDKLFSYRLDDIDENVLPSKAIHFKSLKTKLENSSSVFVPFKDMCEGICQS